MAARDEQLRRQLPDIAIDGRQAYHLYGPWTWLAGSYPHPTYKDEQPESFVPFPDLHFDRVSPDRERYTAYRYRNYDFAPSEILPGFITHQTSRADDTGRMPERKTDDRGMVLLPLRERDWDYLGWKYSLLSSIAVAGWNNVLNMIPARDLEEVRNFSDADRAWFHGWTGPNATASTCGTRGRFSGNLRSAGLTARPRSLGTRGTSSCSTQTVAG